MKNILFSIAMAFIAFTISAQCHLGGTLGFAIQNATYDGESESTSAIAFAPEFEYTINPKWSIGASIGVGYSSNTEITTISFSPYARLTFAQAGPVKFFTEGALAYNSYSYDGESTNGWGIGIRPGMLIDVSDNIQLLGRTTLLQYSETGDGITLKQTSFAINPSLEVGIMFKL